MSSIRTYHAKRKYNAGNEELEQWLSAKTSSRIKTQDKYLRNQERKRENEQHNSSEITKEGARYRSSLADNCALSLSKNCLHFIRVVSCKCHCLTHLMIDLSYQKNLHFDSIVSWKPSYHMIYNMWPPVMPHFPTKQFLQLTSQGSFVYLG